MTTPHPQADLLRAIADGKQMQELDFTGINHPGNWCDCDADRALNRISRDVEQYVRIKPETVTINGIECPAPMRVAPAAQPPADGALNTIAAMFHSAEEIEGPDGLAMMVDMSVWNDALDAFEGIIGDEMEPAKEQA